MGRASTKENKNRYQLVREELANGVIDAEAYNARKNKQSWPFCFKKLDTIGKTVLAGAGFPLLIEISQLPFYDRCSDIDDLILNTTGIMIGALIYFGGKQLKNRKKTVR